MEKQLMIEKRLNQRLYQLLDERNVRLTWIPVTECSPPLETLLVLTDGNKLIIGILTDEDDDECDELREVTHFMRVPPLPCKKEKVGSTKKK
jgi:hypothetical protein